MKPSLMLLAVHSAQEPRDRRSAESWVHFCLKAAEEAYAVVIENPPRLPDGSITKMLNEFHREKGEPEEESYAEGDALRKMAHEAATIAYRACMPYVTGRRNAQAYIACVAAGVQRHYVSGAEARALLYTAQLALAAARPSRAR